MRKILVVLAVGIFLAMAVGSVYAHEAITGPTELNYWDQGKAYNGYTLFSPFRGAVEYDTNRTYLIDMEGNIVKSVTYDPEFSVEKHARLLENGNIVRGIRTLATSGGTGRVPAKYHEVTWGGDYIWEIQDSRPNYVEHHDFRRIWNKALGAYTILAVATIGSGDSIYMTEEEILAAGANPNIRPSYENNRPDGIVEMDLTGNVVWEWNIFDHLIQDYDATKDNFGVVADHPEKMDINFGQSRSGDWIHINSLDYDDDTGLIVLNNSRNSEFYIIDHDGTFILGDPAGSIALAAGPGGDLIYRWGNPCSYDAGECMSLPFEGQATDEGDQVLFFTHDIQWIDDGLPGAGNFLIFDNGTRHPGETFSTIFEINPYDENGNLVPEMVGGHDNQIVWSYRSAGTVGFYSRYISGCQRLPNGNTLIMSGAWGRAFEVTADGELVWEYINPVSSVGVVKYVNNPNRSFNAVFRCLRYGSDYPGLIGQDLTPMGPISNSTFDSAMGTLQGASRFGGGGTDDYYYY